MQFKLDLGLIICKGCMYRQKALADKNQLGNVLGRVYSDFEGVYQNIYLTTKET